MGLDLAPTATFQLFVKNGLEHNALGFLVSTQDNQPRETSQGLAPVPGPRLYDRSYGMDSAMFWMCQNCCAQIVVVKWLRHSGQYQFCCACHVV